MDIRLRVVLVAAMLVSLALVVRISRRASMEAKDAANWFIVAALMLFAAVFPGSIQRFAEVFGISVASNAAFALLIFALLGMVFYLNIRISRLSIMNRELVQKLGIIERGLREGKFPVPDDSLDKKHAN